MSIEVQHGDCTPENWPHPCRFTFSTIDDKLTHNGHPLPSAIIVKVVYDNHLFSAEFDLVNKTFGSAFVPIHQDDDPRDLYGEMIPFDPVLLEIIQMADMLALALGSRTLKEYGEAFNYG